MRGITASSGVEGTGRLGKAVPSQPASIRSMNTFRYLTEKSLSFMEAELMKEAKANATPPPPSGRRNKPFLRSVVARDVIGLKSNN